ncbi:MAG: FAD/NAD(P)-binding protein [Xanthomonadaceae bacterium]|nr:FAD/NAD(P)-binding protein [Xanthomonadaceae bacterium]
MNRYRLPFDAEVAERVQEAADVFSLYLRMPDPDLARDYAFAPGQFNMLYLHGVGEIPISIVSDPEEPDLLMHTLRAVGRVTKGFEKLRVGDHIGVRGPFGRGWPLAQAEGRDLLLITGGLGCAPLVSVIEYVMRRRERFGHVTIIQGVKHHNDLIWRTRYEAWMRQPDTTVLLAADVADAGWSWHVGLVTDLLDQVPLGAQGAATMICGPEPMMQAAAQRCLQLGVHEDEVWLSMERNMQCATGHCGHCQLGPEFICKDGPVFPYTKLRPLLGRRGL